MISRAEVLKGREVQHPLTAGMIVNLNNLLIAVNKVRAAYGKPLVVTSGYRPPEINKAAGGATHSAHLTCEAVDLADPTGEFTSFCLANLDLLEQVGLWMECPKSTNKGPGARWVHLDIRTRKTRIFLP